MVSEGEEKVELPKSVEARARDPISDALGCRIAEPYEVSAIGDKRVLLSPSALVSIHVLPNLAAWVDKDVQPAAMEQFSSLVTDLAISSSYVCRTRNNQPGAKISEHALGNAIDISGFQLENGTTVSVETDWLNDEAAGFFLKAVHKAACTHFSTVLGPEADEHHKTHFHLDRGKHGKDGTYRICQ